MSDIDINHLNIGLRIRNREGLKIYSWGTLNQDMQIMSGLRNGDIYWHKDIKKNDRFKVWYEFECRLGANLYEIQASVSYEAKPDYTEQRILHWKDEAAFFQVLVKTKEYFFGGLSDLQMSAHW
jgi:lipopolysaccharide transport system ATP-binding protein